VQHARLAVGLELAAQVADEDVGDVRARVEGVAPDLLVQPARSRTSPGWRRNSCEQLELAAREVEVAAAARRVRARGSSSSRPRTSVAGAGGRRRSSACSRATTSSSANGLTT
jgi:hypothetical protein